MIERDLSHARLRAQIARNWIGKDRAPVAAEIGIAAGTYSNFELGRRALPAERLPRLAESLCVPTEFLASGPIGWLQAGKLSYRRRAAAKSADLKHVQSVASMAPEFARLIESFVTLPPVTVPLLIPEASGDVEEIAADLRRSLPMSDAPLRHASGLVESMGVLVFWVHGDRMFDGVSFWVDGRAYILLNANQRDAYRARFTVTHELGHLVMHRAADDLSLLEEARSRRDREANDFASAFLLPASSFARRFPRYVEPKSDPGGATLLDGVVRGDGSPRRAAKVDNRRALSPVVRQHLRTRLAAGGAEHACAGGVAGAWVLLRRSGRTRADPDESCGVDCMPGELGD
jgi:hypothetical protein